MARWRNIREALRLNSKSATAHFILGAVLITKRDWEGAITEFREALRLNPDYDLAHFVLGFTLEKKGDPRGALEQYRAAYTLDPNNTSYKQDYERLLQRVNK